MKKTKKIENKRQATGTWLIQYLLANDGTAFTTDILGAAKTHGFSEMTLRQVMAECNVVSRRQGFGKGSRCFWELKDKEQLADTFNELIKHLTNQTKETK